MYICIDKTCMYNTYSKEVRVFKYTFYVSIKYLSTIILVNNQVSNVYISLMAPGFSFLYFIILLFFFVGFVLAIFSVLCWFLFLFYFFLFFIFFAFFCIVCLRSCVQYCQCLKIVHS